MNNVDIAITKVRELQGMLFDRSISSQDLFDKSNEVIEHMNKASVEINTNYEEISEKLTAQLNTGRKQ